MRTQVISGGVLMEEGYRKAHWNLESDSCHLLHRVLGAYGVRRHEKVWRWETNQWEESMYAALGKSSPLLGCVFNAVSAWGTPPELYMQTQATHRLTQLDLGLESLLCSVIGALSGMRRCSFSSLQGTLTEHLPSKAQLAETRALSFPMLPLGCLLFCQEI